MKLSCHDLMVHCSANLLGLHCVFTAWSITIAFNACSPICLERFFAVPNLSMFCGMLANACIFGKFQPQPFPFSSSCRKQVMIFSINFPTRLWALWTSLIVWDSCTQRSHPRYILRQEIIYFKEMFLLLNPGLIHFWPGAVFINTQRRITQLPTRCEPHIFIPLVILFWMDIWG